MASKTKALKKTKKKTATKATAKKSGQRAKAVTGVKAKVKKRQKAAASVSATIDQRLFELANRHCRTVLAKLSQHKNRMDADRKMILEVGERILDKAKTVRDSLIKRHAR